MDAAPAVKDEDEVVRELDVFLCNGCVDAQVRKQAICPGDGCHGLLLCCFLARAVG